MSSEGWAPRLKELLLYALLAVVLTWPLAASGDRAPSRRGDYFVNLWNFWWTHSAVVERGVSPFETDALHHPGGLDLARHTLSLGNALVGGTLAESVGDHRAFKWMLLAHMTLAGFAMCQLARVLTGCRGGALLAGVLWAHAPYHAYYFAQLNLGSMEGLPLAAWAMVVCWRRGGVGPTLGVALSAAWLALTAEYYLVYAGLLGALLCAGGRLWAPDTPWRLGLRRFVVAGALAGLAVAAVAWPLLAATFLDGGGDAPGALPDGGHVASRSNDLLGFLWKGPPEEALVAWPTMLGWTTLAVLALGWRGLRGQGFWLLLAGFFFVMSLGPSLHVGGEDTGVPLPSAALVELPLFSMLRKPDRFLLMVQFCVAILMAGCWRAWPRPERLQRPALALGIALLGCEFALAPLTTFELPLPSAVERLAALPDVTGVVHLPTQSGGSKEARVNWLATRHEHPVAQGYVTSLALGPEQRAAARAWESAWTGLQRADARPLLKQLDVARVDVVVLHKTIPGRRATEALDGRFVWLPFVFARKELLSVRQRGHIEERPLAPAVLARLRATLNTALGPPLDEDDAVIVYRRPLGG